MLIAGRNAMLVESGFTARDYVQDGLVAMWDGIENAGWGIHNPSLGGCVNLVSPNSFDTPYTDLVIGPDYAEVADYNRYINLTNAEGSISWQIAQAWTSTDGGATVEIILNNSGGSAVTRGLVAAGGGGAGSIALGAAALCGIGWKNYRTRYDFSPGTWNHQVIVVSRYGYAFRINGNLVDTQSNPSYSPAEQYTKYISFPGGSTVNGFQFKSWRFYSRAITADEIAANYAIDKARFNLPDAA